MVLVAMGEKAPQYPQTLVSVAKLAFNRPVLSLRLIGVVESKSALSGRIKHILNRPMPKKAKLGIFGLVAVIIIGAILLPMAKAGKDKEVAVEDNVSNESQFIATLPNGVTVELIGLCEHPSEGKQWWQPNGSTLSQRPFEKLHQQIYTKREYYELALKIENSKNRKLSIIGKSGQIFNLYSDNIWGGYVLSEGKKMLNQGIGIAQGPWKTIAQANPKHTQSIGEIAFGKAFESDVEGIGTAVGVTATHTLYKEKLDYRVIAVDRKGNIHKSSRHSGLGGGSWIQTTVHFKNLQIDEIKEFQFQTRPYEWVTFKNVSLKPNFKTDVQVDVIGGSSEIKVSQEMVGTWFFDNPGGDDEQMSVFPDGRVVGLYSNGHRDESRYTDGSIELAEYGGMYKMTLDTDGTLVQYFDSGGSLLIGKRWKRIDPQPSTDLLRVLTGPNGGKPVAQIKSETDWVVEDYGQTRLLSDKEKSDTDNWVSIWASVVKNKGRYLVPDSGLTLKDLIRAAGYNRDKLAESYVELSRRSRQGNITAHSIYSRNLKTLFSGEESDIVLKSNDSVLGGYIEPSANGIEFWSGYHFSEVVELTVNDDGAKINMFADLDTGKLVTPPDTLNNNDENAVLRWIKDNRIDVMGETADSVNGLIGFNMYTARVDNYFWDAGPLEFTDRLMVRIDDPVLLSVENLLPVTYLIKTSEYKMGILQILGFAENPKGIKIRYKLLNKDASPKPDVQVGPVAGDWQYIGQSIPPDFNDTMILTEHVNLGSIGRDAEGKTFITLFRDLEKTKGRQYRFVLFNKAGNILEPDGHLVLGRGERIEEKFTFDEPFLCRRLKGFRFQARPLPPSGFDNISSILQKGTSEVFESETFLPSDLAPPGRYAVELDGVDDYLLVPDSPSLRLEPPFTIEMWVKTKLPPDASEYRGGWALISKGFTVGTPRAYLTGFGINLDRRPNEPSSLCIDFCKSNNSGTYASTYAGYPLTNGVSEWLHITHVFKGEYYKSTPGHPLVMGKFLIPTNNPFKGLLGEVRLWNGARSRQELRQYENVALTGTEPGLAACWTFEQTKGQFARDISGNNNHARLGKFTDLDNADPKWIDLQPPPPQPALKTDLQAVSESISADWQDIGQAIPPDCNDIMVLAEYVNLDSIGQDVEGKVFINLLRDREKTRDQQYRFIMIKTNGAVVEPANYNYLLFGDKLWEKFSFNMPYHHNQIKEFRLQRFPQDMERKVSLPLGKPYDPHIDGKMIASATSGPPGRGALHFDGKGDYLYIPDSSSLWLGPVFTVEMWIKPEFPKKELENWPSWGLISKGCYTGTGRVKNRGFGITLHRFSDDPNLLMIDYNTADDNGIYGKSYGRRDFDSWIHLYHVFRPDRYKPGHGYPLVVGKFITPESPFAGRIGEIRIWRGARSREQISEYRNKPLTGDEPGLRACWTFEQAGGQIAYDISADRNHARLGTTTATDEADPNWVNATDGSILYKEAINETDDQVIARSTIEPIGRHALSFDGVDDYLHVAANPTLTLKPPFTIEMWLKPDFSEVERLKTSEKLLPYLSLMRKGKRLFQERKIQAGGFMMFVAPSSQTDEKHHGSLYLGNANGYAYQVGSSIGDRLQPARPGWLYVSMSCTRETYIPVPDQPLIIGQNIVPSYFPFKGDIAEIRLWSGVRSGDQVVRYRNKPLKGNEPGLVACWDFKSAEGQIVYDISPNGNHARLGSADGPDDADPKWIDLQAPSPQPGQKTNAQVGLEKR